MKTLKPPQKIVYGGRKTEINANDLSEKRSSMVLFVDMNSFFASCEQEVNYYLRGRPVGVCVYTGRNGCVISPSIEAKKKGVKVGMRLPEAMQLCPDMVPLETNPKRYKEFHVKIIQVLRKYSDDVIPKSIDEAVVNLHPYHLLYGDPVEVAKKIKADIKSEVGEWLKCSIGIAPNAFLAKLASDIQKPDGLTIINHGNIDSVLKKLSLKDLPGISNGMENRLQKGGIFTPYDLRHAKPDILKIICKSVVGLHWHYRLNFGEVDMTTSDYKSMSAMRHISTDQRQSIDTLNNILMSLCMRLEQRLVRREMSCKHLFFTLKYTSGYRYDDDIHLLTPLQDGMQMLQLIKSRMERFQQANQCEPVINLQVNSFVVVVNDLQHTEMVQYNLFEDQSKTDRLRKAVYELKDKFGQDKIVKAAELSDVNAFKDVIGFGSIKDLDVTEF